MGLRLEERERERGLRGCSLSGWFSRQHYARRRAGLSSHFRHLGAAAGDWDGFVCVCVYSVCHLINKLLECLNAQRSIITMPDEAESMKSKWARLDCQGNGIDRQSQVESCKASPVRKLYVKRKHRRTGARKRAGANHTPEGGEGE